MRYIFLLPVISVLKPRWTPRKKRNKCAELAASYKTAQNRKSEIETRTAEKQSLDIEEAIFSWPMMAMMKFRMQM